MENKTLKIISIFVFIAVIAGLGGLFVFLGSSWFNSLTVPTEWIPNIVIPIVWTVVYIAFAVVFFFWVKGGDVPRQVLIWGIINGILNVLWCLVFFTLRQLFLGMVIITTNAIFAWLLITAIFKRNKLFAGILLIYPIWLNIATSLNLATWILN